MAAALLRLESCDGVVMDVTRDQAKLSSLLSGCLEEVEDDSPVPLPNVDATTLRMVVDFLKLAEESGVPIIPRPLPLNTESIAAVVPAPFAALIDALSAEQLKTLLTAADYMQVDGLLMLAAAKMAIFIKTMRDSEIVTFFGIRKE